MCRNDIILPIIISFGVSVVLCPILIPFLKKLKFGQFVRDDGPESHLKKSGTPTMGGIIFLLSIVVASLCYIGKYPKIAPILLTTLGFGIIGFTDDFIKVVMKRSMGLRPWQKMIGQFVVMIGFALYISNCTDLGTKIQIPFADKMVDLGWVYYPLMFFVMLGTTNGSNFTDGLDGLASTVTAIIAVFFTVVSVIVRPDIVPISGAMVGALLGFLVFNTYPAKVFMGDTGSLALGGYVASVAYMLQMPLMIIIVAFIYLAEVCSVIIQVGYFKKTGKRVFKMAPIHHHFELCGWPETKVVAIFSIITTILCFVGFLAI